MIHWILVFSRLGKIRLRQHWKTVPLSEKVKIASDVMNLVLPRPKNASNFLEWRDQKLVYKRYASLYFCICCDKDDNELIALESIHRLVQGLDRAFGNVSELDILYGMEKAYSVLDELFIAGEFCEPSLRRLMYNLEEIYGHLADEALKENLGFLEIDDNSSCR